MTERDELRRFFSRRGRSSSSSVEAAAVSANTPRRPAALCERCADRAGNWAPRARVAVAAAYDVALAESTSYDDGSSPPRSSHLPGNCTEVDYLFSRQHSDALALLLDASRARALCSAPACAHLLASFSRHDVLLRRMCAPPPASRRHGAVDEKQSHAVASSTGIERGLR
jgi:hypothetical protein